MNGSARRKEDRAARIPGGGRNTATTPLLATSIQSKTKTGQIYQGTSSDGKGLDMTRKCKYAMRLAKTGSHAKARRGKESKKLHHCRKRQDGDYVAGTAAPREQAHVRGLRANDCARA